MSYAPHLKLLREISSQTGVSLERIKRYWLSAHRYAMEHNRTSSSPGFTRYIISKVKRWAGMHESEAEMLLNMADEIEVPEPIIDWTPERVSFADSVLNDNEHYYPLDRLEKDIYKALGETARKQFKELLISKTTPTNENDRRALIDFFSPRADFASRACLKQLNGETQIPEQTR